MHVRTIIERQNPLILLYFKRIEIKNTIIMTIITTPLLKICTINILQIMIYLKWIHVIVMQKIYTSPNMQRYNWLLLIKNEEEININRRKSKESIIKLKNEKEKKSKRRKSKESIIKLKNEKEKKSNRRKSKESNTKSII